MKLFTVGPVSMFPEVHEVRARKDSVPYFRTKEFSALMLDTDRLLKKFAHADAGAQTIYLTASGTAAMEATILNAFSTEDRILIVNGGTFGQRFVDICEIHRIPHDVVDLLYGETLTREHFAPLLGRKHTALLVNLDETSTGQLYDLNLLSSICKEAGMYLIVDAISAFLSDPLDMEAAGIDALIASSQKGACVSPGLSMVVLSERLIKERVEKSSYRSLYFDFKSYLENFKRGQTPFTPAVGVCVELNVSLRGIETRGLAAHLGEIAKVAADFREKLKALPVSVPAFPLATALTPVVFDQPIAYQVFETLKDKYDVMVNPTGGKLQDRVIRVAHLGDVTLADNAMLVEKMKQAIADVKAAV